MEQLFEKITFILFLLKKGKEAIFQILLVYKPSG